MDSPPPSGRLHDWLALCGALALLALVLVVSSCGGGDLVFPGNIPTVQPPPTVTPAP